MSQPSQKKRSWTRFIKNKYSIGAIIVIVIAVAYVSSHKSGGQTYETAAAAIGNVIERVSVTGKVSPMDKADLSFEKGGVISNIYVKVGDHVSRGQTIASLDSAGDQAALASAQATLADMSRSLNPTELAVQTTALGNAKKDAVNAVHDAYIKAQGAVVNYADIFFSNPQTANPVINVRTDSSSIQLTIDNSRITVTDTLKNWLALIASASTDSAPDALDKAIGYESSVKDFMSALAGIVNGLSPGNSGLSQSTIDADVTAINSGLSAVNAANDALSNAESALRTAQSNYDLKLAGNSTEAIAAQAAKVDQAKASLANDSIVSPVNGIVTRADPNVGEYASPGTSGFAVQSDAAFKIEAYVPEADIAKVKLGDMASTTLDAYGSNVDFPAVVTSINPAETVLEGVPTYKVTLQFVDKDDRVRSGMTANLEILTNERDNVISIPTRALVDDTTAGAPTGAKAVRILSPDGKSYDTVPVTVGLKGSDGTTEIISGLSEGQKVVTYVK